MTILPVDPVANATPEALRAFLASCQELAVRDGRSKLVSISVAVDALDPLAVLESIFEPGEPHFYAERPSLDSAIAGAEAVLAVEAQGPGRFATVQRFVDTTLEDTIAVGDVSASFGGPHFFAAFAFNDRVENGEPFPSARVFVPRWQVARAAGRTTAVANLLVTKDAPLDRLAEKVWRAHKKFRAFEYQVDRGSESSTEGLNSPPVATKAISWKTEDNGDYPAAVRTALQHIGRGEFNKIVVARTRSIRSSEALHPLKMLNGLRQRFPD